MYVHACMHACLKRQACRLQHCLQHFQIQDTLSLQLQVDLLQAALAYSSTIMVQTNCMLSADDETEGPNMQAPAKTHASKTQTPHRQASAACNQMFTRWKA